MAPYGHQPARRRIKPLDQRHRRAGRRALGAILDLQSKAEPQLRKSAAIDALGARLHEHLARQRAHDDRVGAALARHQVGVLPARIQNAGDRGAPLRRHALARDEPGEHARHHRQRHRPVRHRAAVDAAHLRPELAARRSRRARDARVAARDGLAPSIRRSARADARPSPACRRACPSSCCAAASASRRRRSARWRRRRRAARARHRQGRGRETRAIEHGGGEDAHAARCRRASRTRARSRPPRSRSGRRRPSRSAAAPATPSPPSADRRALDIAQRQRQRARRCSDGDRAAVPALDQLARASPR